MRRVIALGLIAAVLLVAISSAHAGQASSVFYARVDYLLRTEEPVELDFGSRSVITLSSAAAPPGFALDSFVLVFDEKAPAQVVPIKYDKASKRMDVLVSVTSYSGEISLGSNGFNGTLKARLITTFRRTSWIPLSENLTLDTSEFKDTGLQIVVRVTIDNYAPYAIKSVIGPSGDELTSPEMQAALPAGAVKVDPKHFEVDVSRVGTGKYTLILGEGEGYKMPNSFLVVEDRFTEITVPAKTAKPYTLRSKAGWNPLGFIVVLYSVSPGPLSSNVNVEGELVDMAFERSEEFEVRGASLLIPPLLMHYWIKAFLVYGTSAKIVNNENHDVQAIIVPVYYKEVGTWTPKGLAVTVTKKDLADAYAAYIVVQVPAIASITSITVPGGQKIEAIENFTTNWLGTWRTAVMEKNEAAIQVKNGDSVEEGDYFFAITWQPLKFVFRDPKGNPIPGVQVAVEGPSRLSAVSGVDGSAAVNVYAPGVYTVTARFKGTTLASLTIGTFTDTEFNIECKVYTLTVNVKSALGGPVAGAVVTVSNGNFTQSLETDSSGSVRFVQLPGGTYKVTAQYKRISAASEVNLQSDQSLDVNTGILFDLPLIGPVTAIEVAAASAATAASTVLFFRPRKEEEVAEIEIG